MINIYFSVATYLIFPSWFNRFCVILEKNVSYCRQLKKTEHLLYIKIIGGKVWTLHVCTHSFFSLKTLCTFIDFALVSFKHVGPKTNNFHLWLLVLFIIIVDICIHSLSYHIWYLNYILNFFSYAFGTSLKFYNQQG